MKFKRVSLKNLSTSTAQEVFDHVVSRLLKQNEKSGIKQEGSTYTSCRYRGPKGTKCAAGHIMTNKEYNPDFECRDWDGLIKSFKISDNHERLIGKLQITHDNSDVNMWRKDFEKLAEFENLEWKF